MSEPVIGVMLVDDHAVVRRGLVAFLETFPDMRVVGEASDGTQAIRRLGVLEAEDGLPDVILMDLAMQPMDGVEATLRIRERWPGVEVVAVTSFVEEERVHAALQAGATGYILKDAAPEELASAIRAAHRGEMQLDPAVAARLMAALHERPTPVARALDQLTDREREVLVLLGQGGSNKQIALQLSISEHTVRTHVSSLLGKLGVTSRTQAALLATREGLTAPD
ncbi:MAG: response regulator transcription factor [Thermoleophilia bacterium]